MSFCVVLHAKVVLLHIQDPNLKCAIDTTQLTRLPNNYCISFNFHSILNEFFYFLQATKIENVSHSLINIVMSGYFYLDVLL